MNKIAKSSLSKGRTLEFKQEAKAIRDIKLPYPILGIESLEYEGQAYLSGNYPHVEMDVKIAAVLEDSYDGVSFLSEFSFYDEADILEKEDEVGEGYIMSGPNIELDNLAIYMLHSLLPIKVRRPDAKDRDDEVIYRFSEED